MAKISSEAALHIVEAIKGCNPTLRCGHPSNEALALNDVEFHHPGDYDYTYRVIVIGTPLTCPTCGQTRYAYSVEGGDIPTGEPGGYPHKHGRLPTRGEIIEEVLGDVITCWISQESTKSITADEREALRAEISQILQVLEAENPEYYSELWTS